MRSILGRLMHRWVDNIAADWDEFWSQMQGEDHRDHALQDLLMIRLTPDIQILGKNDLGVLQLEYYVVVTADFSKRPRITYEHRINPTAEMQEIYDLSRAYELLRVEGWKLAEKMKKELPNHQVYVSFLHQCI